MDKEKDTLESSFVSAINLAVAFHRKTMGKKSVELKNTLKQKLDQSMPAFSQSNEYAAVVGPVISSYALARIPPTSNVNTNMYWDVIKGADGEAASLASDVSNTTIYIPHTQGHITGYDLRNDILTYWDALNQALEAHCNRDKTTLDNAIYGDPDLRNDDSSEDELLFNVITEDESVSNGANLEWPQDENELDAIITSEKAFAEAAALQPPEEPKVSIGNGNIGGEEDLPEFTPEHNVPIHSVKRDNLTDPAIKPVSHFGSAAAETMPNVREKLQDSFIISALFAGGLFDNVHDNVKAIQKAQQLYKQSPDTFKKLVKSSVLEKSHGAFLMGLVAKPNEKYEISKMSDAMKQDVVNNLKLNRMVLFGGSAMSGEDITAAAYSISRAHTKPLTYTQYFGDDGNETTVQIVHMTHILEKAGHLYKNLMDAIVQDKADTLKWINKMDDPVTADMQVTAYAWLTSSVRRLQREMNRQQSRHAANIDTNEEIGYARKKIELVQVYNDSMITSYKQSLDKYKKIIASLIARVKKFTELELKKAKSDTPYDQIKADYKRFIPFVITTINEQLDFNAVQLELKETKMMPDNIRDAADALDNMRPNTGFYEVAIQIQTVIVTLLTKFDKEITEIYTGYIRTREKLLTSNVANLGKAISHLEKEKMISFNKDKITEQLRKYATKAMLIKQHAPERLRPIMEQAATVQDPNSAFFYDFDGEGLAKTLVVADPLINYVHYICKHIQDFRLLTKDIEVFVTPAIVSDFYQQLHAFNQKNSRAAIDHPDEIPVPIVMPDGWETLKGVQKMIIKNGGGIIKSKGDVSFELVGEYTQWLLVVIVEGEIYSALYENQNASDMDNVFMEDFYMFGGAAAPQVDPTLLNNPKTRQEQLIKLLKVSEQNLKQVSIDYAAAQATGDKATQIELQKKMELWEQNVNNIKSEIEVIIATKARNDSSYLHQARNWIFFDANKELPNTLKSLYYQCNGLIAYLTSDIVNTRETKFMKALVSFGMSRDWPTRKTLKYQKYTLDFVDAGSPQERGVVLAKAVDYFALLMLYSYVYEKEQPIRVDDSLNGLHELVTKATKGEIDITILTKSRKINLKEGFKSISDKQVLEIWTLTQWLRDEVRCTPGGLTLQPTQYAVKPNGVCGKNPFIKTNNILQEKNVPPVQFANSAMDKISEDLNAQSIADAIDMIPETPNYVEQGIATGAGAQMFKALPQRYNPPHSVELELGTCFDYVSRSGAACKNPCINLLKGLTAHPPY